MSDSNQRPNFIDRVGKVAIFGFFGFLVVAVITFPIVFSMVKTGAISEENIPFQEIKSSPEEIFDIIGTQQELYVKESYGQEDHQCFTASDLAMFKNTLVQNKITTNLRNNSKFLSIVHAAKQLSEEDFSVLVEKARTTRRPTWDELGQVSAAGQTQAGKEAELIVANAITDLFIEMSN